MAIDLEERVTFLSQTFLCYGFSKEQTILLANSLEEVIFPAGSHITTQGEASGMLFIIWSGKAKIIQAEISSPETIFCKGDYLGGEAIIKKEWSWHATIIAVDEVEVFVLKRDQFNLLRNKIPRFVSNIQIVIKGHLRAQKAHFKWLPVGETIHFIERKHPILLARMLSGPILLAIVSLIGMLVSWYYSLWNASMSSYWYIALILGLVATSWGIWKGLDWGNDYYIVTDRRAVWVEKVIGLYESRQETPLSAIQRVHVDTDITGRMLDYGDIVIQTIVGSSIKMKNVNHPFHAAALINQYWRRSRDLNLDLDEKEIQDMLRSRLLNGKPDQDKNASIVQLPGKQADQFQDKHGLSNLFRLRFEQYSTVTYRKHLFVLLKQIRLPLLAVFSLVIYLTIKLLSPPRSFVDKFSGQGSLILLLWGLLFISSLFWLIYQYIDWSNDIFQVTPDQIRDIDKTPLGMVKTDIASLDNILSIEYRRKGILELLFNYGTVFITIGGGKEMAFEDVHNPAAVQDDIERRRLERVTKQKQENIRAERERVSDWFASYYENEDKIRQDDIDRNKESSGNN